MVLFGRGHKTADFRKRVTFHLHVKKETGSGKGKVRKMNNKYLSLPRSQTKMCIFEHNWSAFRWTPTVLNSLMMPFSPTQCKLNALCFLILFYNNHVLFLYSEKHAHWKAPELVLWFISLQSFLCLPPPLPTLLLPKRKGRQDISMTFIYRNLAQPIL